MNLLPDEVLPTVLCYAVSEGPEEDEDEVTDESPGCVDIVYCNSNGYLIEVLNKKIVNSCYLSIDNATKILIFYKYNKISYELYYLIQSDDGMLVVVKKRKNMLLVGKCYKNIKDCKIFDFENRGYPQVVMYDLNGDVVDSENITDFDDFQLGINNYFTDSPSEFKDGILSKDFNISDILQETGEDVNVTNATNVDNVLSNFLSKNLKEVEIYRDELNFELSNMNKILKRMIDKNTLLSPSVSNDNALVEQNTILKITNTWFRIFNSSWIWGIELWSCNARNSHDIEVVLRSEYFSNYTYRCFLLSDIPVKKSSCSPTQIKEFQNEEIQTFAFNEGVEEFPHFGANVHRIETEGISSAKTSNCGHEVGVKSDDASTQNRSGSKYVVVVALDIPEFDRPGNYSAAFTLIYDGRQTHTKTFNLMPKHFMSDSYYPFHNQSETSLSEDLMACLTVSKKVSLKVDIRYYHNTSFEDVLSQTLGFIKVNLLREEYFIKRFGPLSGTSISVKKLERSTWKLDIYTREISLLYILAKSLQKELPLTTKIQLIDNN